MVKKEVPTMREYLGDEAAEIYERRTGLKKLKQKATLKAIEFLGLKKNSLILDAGCGTGWSTEVIQEMGYRVIGFDISKSMLKIARRKGFKVVLCDLRHLKCFKPNTFDGIISISALNFIAEGIRGYGNFLKVYRKVAKAFNEILKKKGRVVIEYYPQSEEELKASMKAFKLEGFSGGLQIEGYKTRKEQKFLILEKD